MFLVQLLLPVRDNQRRRFAKTLFKSVAAELTERFGGLTAHTRAPAQGLWQDKQADTTRDDIVIFEVMAESLQRDWWRDYRRSLELRFRQQQLIVRAQDIELL